MIVSRVFGRTPNSDLVTKFSSWLVENLNSMDTLEDEEAVQGTMTLDFQVPTNSFVVEVQTYSQEFASKIVKQMKEFGFENASTLGVEREGGIK